MEGFRAGLYYCASKSGLMIRLYRQAISSSRWRNPPKNDRGNRKKRHNGAILHLNTSGGETVAEPDRFSRNPVLGDSGPRQYSGGKNGCRFIRPRPLKKIGGSPTGGNVIIGTGGIRGEQVAVL